MDDFIAIITSQLGISREQGQNATGGILKVLQEKLDTSAFSDLLNQLPGAENLLSQAEAKPQGLSSGGGGLMGSLTSMAGSLLGGGGDSMAARVAKTLGESGIGLDKVGGFLTSLISYLKEKLGDDGFNALAAKLPDLLKLGR